jgi:hypothetical protein
MLESRFSPASRESPAALQKQRQRIRAEVREVIAGARKTMDQSRLLLAEADAILAREGLPHATPDVWLGEF